MLAGVVIDAARGRHAAFRRESHPNKVALQALSEYALKLHGKIVQLDPNVAATVVTQAMPLADHDAGITMPGGTRLVLEVTAHFRASNAPPRDPLPVHIIDRSQRLAPNSPLAAAWRLGGVLYLRSPATLWQNFDSVDLAVVVTPGPLTSLLDVVGVPDAAFNCCASYVAQSLAYREKQENADSPISLDAFTAKAGSDEEEYLRDVGNDVANREFITEDIWRP